jgi:hypothetical protein
MIGGGPGAVANPNNGPAGICHTITAITYSLHRAPSVCPCKAELSYRLDLMDMQICSSTSYALYTVHSYS